MSFRVSGNTAIKKTHPRYSVTQEALTSPTTTKHENASIIIDTYHAERPLRLKLLVSLCGLHYLIFRSSNDLFYFTIKILSFGVMNLIYTANVIFQVTFSVYRMIKLSEAELASTVLSYTVKLFRSITETLCGHEGIFSAQEGAVEFNPPCHTGKGLLCKRDSFLCRSLP